MDDSASPSTIGPYRVLGVLGRGGMGVVYRGEHVETLASVAVKTLHSRSDVPLASIRREIQALSRLRHPGVVGIVGHGVSAGVPWYAMDLLSGRTFRHHLALADDVRLRATAGTGNVGSSAVATETKACVGRPGGPPLVERVPTRFAERTHRLAILMRCCEPLSYLHAMGVVHRDLKPENIFVRDGGSPVLVDLGLAASFGGQQGREQLEVAGDLAGTLAYMAPEQIRGELVDARADLYALGCILYECVTGEPPFAGVPPFAVLDAHLHRRPLPPSAVADGVPADLDRLILRLLEKRPRDRVGYADDVAAALRPYSGETASASSPARPRRPYLYRPPFVGRASALAELKDVVRQIGSGVTRVYVAGESGVGKTRLVLEALNQSVCDAASIVLSRCGSLGVGPDASSGDRPLHAFAPALLAVADHCRDSAAESQRILGAWAKVLAPYQPAFEQVQGYSSLPDPEPLNPREARARVLAALDEVLHAFAALRPLIIAIDDLHWADELSLAYLRRPCERPSPLLVLGTYRADEASPTLRDVVTAPGARHLQLGRFGLDEVGAMVGGMLALDLPPPELVRFLQRKCEGNAFFVVSYLHAAISEGLLSRCEDGRWQLGAAQNLSDRTEALEMPAELAELIDLRLRRVSAGSLTLVQAGAALGREFDSDLLFACASLPGAEAADMLQTLRERQILEESGNGGLRFVHDKIRESVYARTPPATLRDLHRRAAHAIQARRGDALEVSALLAEHFSRAGLHDHAATHFDRAGDFAASAYANGDALHRYQAALRELALAAPTPVSITRRRLLEKMGDVMSVTGEHESARRCFEEALQCAPDVDVLSPARLHRKIGKLWEIHHNHAEALHSYGRGAEVLGAGGVDQDDAWWHEVIQVTIERLWVHYWLNDVDPMDRLIAQSTAMLDEHGTGYQKARFKQLMAMRNIRRERYLVSDATVALARAAMTAASDNTEEERAALRFVLFFTLYLRGRLDEAEREGLAVLAWASRAGASTLRVRTLTYLTAIARKRARVDAVRDLLDQTRAICEPSPPAQRPTGLSVYYPGALHANMAWLALKKREYDEVERYGRSALTSWQSERVPYPFQWLARFPLIAVSALREDIRAAIEHAEALLADDQQRLEQPLACAIGSMLATARARASVDTNTILSMARDHHYL